MKLRFLLLAAVLGAVVSVAWGTVSHRSGVLPSLNPYFYEDLNLILKQLAIEFVVVLLFAWILLRLPVWPVLGTGSFFATVGTAAGIEFFRESTGIALAAQLAELADLVIGWFLVGLVIGWLRNRMLAAPARP